MSGDPENSTGQRVLIIAEIGSVHDGSFGNALKLIEAAAAAGADAVKFQTHIAAEETLRNAPMPPYFKGEPRYEYFERTAFTCDQWMGLRQHCEQSRVRFISSPFSDAAVRLLDEVGVETFKVGSGEITNLPMIDLVARTGRAVILSSGMSTWEELDAAVAAVRRHHDRLSVLQCTSEYPCAYEAVGLNLMESMGRRYQVPVGLSDHTLTNYASFAAVMLGATIVERHFTFSRLMYGSDARHSLEPAEFAELVRGIRALEVLRRSPVDKDAVAQRLRGMKDVFEKSVVSITAIPANAVVTAAMLGIKKPGTGIPARRLPDLIGRRAARPIAADVLLKEEDLYA